MTIKAEVSETTEELAAKISGMVDKALNSEAQLLMLFQQGDELRIIPINVGPAKAMEMSEVLSAALREAQDFEPTSETRH